jgi:hypothetical protein
MAMIERSPDRDPMAFSDAEVADGAPLLNGRGDDLPVGAFIVRNAGAIRATPIPPRQWLLGTAFCRKFLSALVGAGGDGKTAIRYAQYLSVASGRNLTGEHVHHRGRVLISCLEDDEDEVRRRIDAVMRHHGIAPDELDGWLFYCAPRGLKLMSSGPSGGPRRGQLYTELCTAITKLQIDLIGLDPFIKAHSAEENDNNALDEVCILLATLAAENNIAADLIHHSRKGSANPGDAERSRGASATVDACRLVRTVTRMSDGDAATMGIPPENQQTLIRVDDAKINLTRRAGDAMWFKLIGVLLDNGTPDYPHGDNVQTVERWTPPDNFAGVTTDTWNAIIDEIDKGMENGQRYSDAPAATDRAAWAVVTKHIDRTKEQARAIIKTWVENQVLIKVEYKDPTARKPRMGLSANPANRPGAKTNGLVRH